MDRQMAQMMYQARMMQAQAVRDPLYNATLKDMPAGSSNFTFVSTGGTFCMRSTQITSSPNGGAPKVVTQTSGNCGDAASAPNQTSVPAAAPGLQPTTYKLSDHQTRHGI